MWYTIPHLWVKVTTYVVYYTTYVVYYTTNVYSPEIPILCIELDFKEISYLVLTLVAIVHLMMDKAWTLLTMYVCKAFDLLKIFLQLVSCSENTGLIQI